MVSADDFYGSPAWDAATQAEFDARIVRVPKGGSRARRYEDKAWALFYRSYDRTRQLDAITLLMRAVAEAHATALRRGAILERAAFYQIKLGMRQTARVLLERALELAPYEKRATAANALAAEQLFARLLVEQGEPDRARAVLIAWDEARVRRHGPRVRRVPLVELASHAMPGVSLDAAADAFVLHHRVGDPPEPPIPLVADATRDALVAIDQHYAVEKESLELRFAPALYRATAPPFVIVAELGAYVGRVLVGARAGVWRKGETLLQSRVVAGTTAIDPFAVAYDALYFGIPLAYSFDRLIATS